MREILVIGLFGHFEKYGFKAFFSVSESPNWPREREGGLKERGGVGVCRKVLYKCFIEYPNTHQS